MRVTINGIECSPAIVEQDPVIIELKININSLTKENASALIAFLRSYDIRTDSPNKEFIEQYIGWIERKVNG